MKEFTGRIAVVTGGGSGIQEGFAIAGMKTSFRCSGWAPAIGFAAV
jgi:hypothetical protein